VPYETGITSRATERDAQTTDASLVLFALLCRPRQHAREAAALRDAVAVAASATPYVDPLQRILELALPVLPADHLVLLRVSIERSESVILAAAGTARIWRGLRAPLGPGAVARAIDSSETQLIADDASGPNAPTGRSTRSVLVAPVILEGRVFGVLETAHEQPRRFTQRHADLLAAFAGQCAIAIVNAREG
jgi:GAF domain-containing protein